MKKAILIVCLLALVVSLSGCIQMDSSSTTELPADNQFENPKPNSTENITQEGEPAMTTGKTPKEISIKPEDVINDGYSLVKDREENLSDYVISYTAVFKNVNGETFGQTSNQVRDKSEIDLVALKNAQIAAQGYKEWEKFSIGESSYGLKQGENLAIYRLIFKKQTYVIDLMVVTQNEEQAKAILNKYGKIIESRID